MTAGKGRAAGVVAVTRPTPEQLVALGLNAIEAHAVVSALALLEHVPAETLMRAAMRTREGGDDSNLLTSVFALRVFLPEQPARRSHDDSATHTTGRAR